MGSRKWFIKEFITHRNNDKPSVLLRIFAMETHIHPKFYGFHPTATVAESGEAVHLLWVGHPGSLQCNSPKHKRPKEAQPLRVGGPAVGARGQADPKFGYKWLWSL